MRNSILSALALAALCFMSAPAPVSANDAGGPGVVAKPAGTEASGKSGAKTTKPAANKQKGVASYYSKKFNHRKTASGVPLDPNKKTAASKTLPIGTKAEVTNTENGKKTEVVITDRGPYVKDRVIDVTPKAAEELGMKEDGVAKVEVKPVEVPHTEEQKKEAIEHPPQ